jgi:hypothetical protein
MWTPSSEFTIQVSEEQKRFYKVNDARSIYYDSRWIYRKGRHKGGEFPVVVARKHFMDQGYKVWVSGQSKLGIDAFILAMFPSARKARDQSYLNMVKVFGEKKLDRFIAIIEQEKEKCGLARHGGDPDLFVQSTQNPSDRFFVEVKAEDFTGRRRYHDKLNKQQHLLFPLIETQLKCQVRLAKVQIITDSTISNEYQETPANHALKRDAAKSLRAP